MKLNRDKLTATIKVNLNSPPGEPMTAKIPLYAPGNLAWLKSHGYLVDGEFTDKAVELVEAKVLKNTSEYGRGVRGQTMFIPKDARPEYFEYEGSDSEEPKRRGRKPRE